MQGYASSREHVFEELRRIDLLVNICVARQRLDPAFAGFNEFRGLFISEQEIDHMINGSGPQRNGAENPAEVGPMIAALDQLEQRIARRIKSTRRLSLALPRLAGLFQLSAFDVDALLVCMAPEINRTYEKLYAYLQNDVTRKRPSVELVLNLLCHSLDDRLQARARLSPAGALLGHQLVAYPADAQIEQPTFLSRFLQVDQRILNYLLDVDAGDEQLVPWAQQVAPRATLADLALPAELQATLARLVQEHTAGRAFLFHGPPGVGKQRVAEALCQSIGAALLCADTPQMLTGATPFAALVTRLLREARLRDAAVYLDRAEVLLGDQEPAAEARAALMRALAEFPGIAFVGSAQPWHAVADPQPALLKVTFAAPGYELRERLWRDELAQTGRTVATNVDLAELIDKFRFTARQIRGAAVEAAALALMRGVGGDAITADDLHRACRAQSSTRLATLARKVTPLYTWDDIILPRDSLRQLRDICAHVRHRRQVLDAWGFGGKLSLGKGLSALFIGASGTGKTMAAEIIAIELALDLYKIDLSSVVSKYIGETEKNLSAIFREAEQSNAILFFDEADAIFGKRSEVKDSHDRYANIEINYLLQRVEEYEGIVILASNFHKNIDEAFTRRMRFVVEFPFPSEEYRYQIWQSVFPNDMPRDDEIDFAFLAKKFALAGGNIKNIVLGAAFLAAADAGPVTIDHLIRATRREFQKLGRACVKADFEQYYDLIEEEQAV